MNLIEAHRIMCAFERNHPACAALNPGSPGDMAQLTAYLQTIPEGDEVRAALKVFAESDRDGMLSAVHDKCIEIARMNPEGGLMDDLWAMAVEAVEMERQGKSGN